MKTRIIVLITVILVGIIDSIYAQSIKTQNVQINEGSGSFQISGGSGHEIDVITIFYHKPKNFTPKSRFLIVIPGSGRNGDSYRDSWIETSEKHNVLILSPSYPEKTYPYKDYHLGGVVNELDVKDAITFEKNSNRVHMDEDKVKFNVNSNSNQWLYPDFDRIFEIAKMTVRSKQKKYDMFGHSAGGQILHRFVLFSPNSKADRILASNAGSYTFPVFDTGFPFGLKNTDFIDLNIQQSLKKQLVLFLGELDNEDEMGGLLLRSKTADKHGTHRLERGTNFFKKGEETAKSLNAKFNWKLKVIPGIGHKQRKMAKEAGKYLYEKKS